MQDGRGKEVVLFVLFSKCLQKRRKQYDDAKRAFTFWQRSAFLIDFHSWQKLSARTMAGVLPTRNASSRSAFRGG